MKEEKVLKDFEGLMGELKVLMSSFHPDSKLAELMKQATTSAHKETKLQENMSAMRYTLIFIAIIGVANLLLMWGLAS